MKTIVRVFTHLLLVCGLLVFIAMPRGNKYTWMEDMDPSIAMLPVDDTSGDRTVFMLLLLIVVVITQLGIAITTESKKEKMISIVLAIVAISAWLLR